MERTSLTSWKVTVPCAGCGADLTVEPDRHSVDCDFCHATSVVDLGGVATCFRLGSTLDEVGTGAAALRWLRERSLQETSIDLEVSEEILIPFWSLRTSEGERSMLAVDRADLQLDPNTRQPAGQLEQIDLDAPEGLGATLVEATVPLPSAFDRFGVDPEGAKVKLVYAPFRTCRYEWGGVAYEMLVDVTSGTIHSYVWPRIQDPSLDRKLGMLLAGAILLFTLVSAFVPGLVLTVVAMLVVSVPLWWVLDRSIVSSKGTS